MSCIYDQIRTAIEKGYHLDKFAISRQIGIIPADFPRYEPVNEPPKNIVIFKKTGYKDIEIEIGETSQDDIRAFCKE